MQELITITTGEQGSPVVKSARELHAFLEVKSKFADWFKNRVNKYSFTEGVDYVVVSKSLDDEGFSKFLEKGGRPEIDYALSLDMAKELSMVERNAKGKQARQYFIECEKRIQALPVLSPAQQLLQQAQLLVSHEDRIAKLEKALSVLQERQQNRLEIEPARSVRPMAIETLRSKVAQLVSQYAERSNTAYYVVWNQVYNRLHVLYGFNVRAQRKTSYENLLDVAERHSQLERIYSIIQAEINYSDEG